MLSDVDGLKTRAQEDLARSLIKLGVYRHYKGGEYILCGLSLMENDLGVLLTYWSVSRKTFWTRTKEEFFGDAPRSQIAEGPGTPRFAFIREATAQEWTTTLQAMMRACLVTVFSTGDFRALVDGAEVGQDRLIELTTQDFRTKDERFQALTRTLEATRWVLGPRKP
jgi:hypothetical protein